MLANYMTYLSSLIEIEDSDSREELKLSVELIKRTLYDINTKKDIVDKAALTIQKLSAIKELPPIFIGMHRQLLEITDVFQEQYIRGSNLSRPINLLLFTDTVVIVKVNKKKKDKFCYLYHFDYRDILSYSKEDDNLACYICINRDNVQFSRRLAAFHDLSVLSSGSKLSLAMSSAKLSMMKNFSKLSLATKKQSHQLVNFFTSKKNLTTTKRTDSKTLLNNNTCCFSSAECAMSTASSTASTLHTRDSFWNMTSLHDGRLSLCYRFSNASERAQFLQPIMKATTAGTLFG
jgi:hypothetical protein